MISRRRALVLGSAFVASASGWFSRVASADGQTPAPAPTSSELEALLAKIGRARAPLKTLVGPFEQTRKLGLLATEVRSSGMMYLACPDRLRWELFPPDEVVYWVLPDVVAYKSKSGEGRVQGPAGRIGAVLEDLRAVLGGDLAALKARYDLRLLPSDAASDGPSFEAVPRAPTAHLQRIQFSLSADLVRPTKATLIETARDRTDISFGRLQRDVSIDPSKMRVRG